jgi:hypothetical protein
MRFGLYWQEDAGGQTITLVSTETGAALPTMGLVIAKLNCNDIREAFDLPSATNEECRNLINLNTELLSPLAESLFKSGRQRSGSANNLVVVDIGLNDLRRLKGQFRIEPSLSVPFYGSVR